MLRTNKLPITKSLGARQSASKVVDSPDLQKPEQPSHLDAASPPEVLSSELANSVDAQLVDAATLIADVESYTAGPAAPESIPEFESIAEAETASASAIIDEHIVLEVPVAAVAKTPDTQTEPQETDQEVDIAMEPKQETQLPQIPVAHAVQTTKKDAIKNPVIETPTQLANGLTYKLDIGMPPPPSGGYRADQMGVILEKLGVIPSRVHFAMERESLTKEHLSQIMRDFNFLSSENVARALAIQANLEFFPSDKVDDLKIDKAGIEELQADMPIYQGFAPIFFDSAKSKLVLAVADAQNISTAANRFFKYKTTVVIASEGTIQLVFRKYFASTEAAFDRELKKYQDITDSRDQDLDQAPGLLRDLFGALLRHACTQKVSDIHMHMTEHVGLIKLTMDGVSTIFRSIPQDLYSRLLTRLISDAKIKTEDLRNGMKEGSVEWNAADAELFNDVFSRYGFRLQLGEAKGGYTAVIRILDRNANASELSHLDFDDWTSTQLKHIVATSAGLMLITGPTGSGKTTTLYAILKEIDPVTRSIQTIEHPVEYRHGLWMQYEISRTAKSEGDEWGKMLKGLLRNAPKVILMGEVRDADTAKTLIEAANTGHLVFTTLHTNTAAMAIARLKKLEVDMDSLAGELLGVLAQRLVRLLCERCKVEDTDQESYAELSTKRNLKFLDTYQPFKLFKASVRGCPHCSFTGYRGRKIVYELLVMNPAVRSAIEMNAPTSGIAKAGIRTGYSMWDCGLKIVARGLTSLDALRSVAHKDVALDEVDEADKE